MTTDRAHDIIPEGELPCVWMEAGMVGFKLCDQQYDCEHCPFDTVIRQQLQNNGKKSPAMSEPSHPPQTADSPTALGERLEQQLAVLLRPFSDPALPSDRLYAANHLWVEESDPKKFTVGVDHIVLHLLGSFSTIAFLATPTHAHFTSPCSWIIHRFGTIALKTPLAGTITQTNSRLMEDPSLLNHEPYGAGWMFRITPDTLKQTRRGLFPAQKAALIYEQQAKALREQLRVSLKNKIASVGPTLHDGGRMMDNIEDMLGPKAYFQLVTSVLSLG